MLVLTRKPGEQIIIGNTIRVTVVSVGHGRVKIGVEAPPNVSIDRQEVHDRKAQESPAALADAEPKPVVVDVNGRAPVLHNRIADHLPTAAADGGMMLAQSPRGSDPRKPR